MSKQKLYMPTKNEMISISCKGKVGKGMSTSAIKSFNKIHNELSEYEQLEKFFKKLDKIWQSEFGKECPEFVPDCAQCKFSLIYNKFKQEVFDEVLR